MAKQTKEKAFAGDGIQKYSTKVEWFVWNRNEKDSANWERNVSFAVARLKEVSPDLVEKFRDLAKKTQELFPNRQETKAELLCWLVDQNAVTGKMVYRKAIDVLHTIAMQEKAKGRLEQAFMKVRGMREDYGAGYFVMNVALDLMEMLPLTERRKCFHLGRKMDRNSIAD